MHPEHRIFAVGYAFQIYSYPPSLSHFAIASLILSIIRFHKPPKELHPFVSYIASAICSIRSKVLVTFKPSAGQNEYSPLYERRRILDLYDCGVP